MKKPREFWINTFSNVVLEKEPDMVLKMDKEIVHVIEISIFENAKKAFQEAHDLYCSEKSKLSNDGYCESDYVRSCLPEFENDIDVAKREIRALRKLLRNMEEIHEQELADAASTIESGKK